MGEFYKYSRVSKLKFDISNDLKKIKDCTKVGKNKKYLQMKKT